MTVKHNGRGRYIQASKCKLHRNLIDNSWLLSYVMMLCQERLILIRVDSPMHRPSLDGRTPLQPHWVVMRQLRLECNMQCDSFTRLIKRCGSRLSSTLHFYKQRAHYRAQCQHQGYEFPIFHSRALVQSPALHSSTYSRMVLCSMVPFISPPRPHPRTMARTMV